MSDTTASWITLSALLLCAIVLFARNRDFSGHNIMMTAVTSCLCFAGGLLITGAVIKVTGGIDNPVAKSLLVVVGSLICVTGKEFFRARTTRVSE
ncbi:MAG: hypothetical protein ACPGF7_09970 [Pontibacterium sp.]